MSPWRAYSVAAVQPAGKALPVEKFHTEKWKVLDADVHFTADHIVAEIGELLLENGERLRRRGDDEITLFKSLGLAVEDLAAAHHVYQKASASLTGSWIALGGSHADAQEELHA